LIELPEDSEEVQEESMQQQVSQLHVHGLGDSVEGKPGGVEEKASGEEKEEIEGHKADSSETVKSTTIPSTPPTTTPSSATPPIPPQTVPPTPTTAVPQQQTVAQAAASPPARDLVDEILFWAMTVVGLAIFYLLLRRFNRSADGAGRDL
jgi:hypothetical protein